MLVDRDLLNMNVRREHLAHLVHYKVNIKWMKEMAKRMGRPISILNVGCGEVNELRMFYTADSTEKKKVIKEYVGLEGDAKCVAATEKKAATVLKGVNGSIEICDITKGNFPVKAGHFDLIICNEVLEHIPGAAVPLVLKAIRRAARSTAVILISTPNKDGTNERLPADHVKEWKYDELHEAFTHAGLEEIDELGVYIKKSNLLRYLRDNGEPAVAEAAESLWDRFGLDIGSMMTADLARPVANNLIHILKKKVG